MACVLVLAAGRPLAAAAPCVDVQGASEFVEAVRARGLLVEATCPAQAVLGQDPDTRGLRLTLMDVRGVRLVLPVPDLTAAVDLTEAWFARELDASAVEPAPERPVTAGAEPAAGGATARPAADVVTPAPAPAPASRWAAESAIGLDLVIDRRGAGWIGPRFRIGRGPLLVTAAYWWTPGVTAGELEVARSRTELGAGGHGTVAGLRVRGELAAVIRTATPTGIVLGRGAERFTVAGVGLALGRCGRARLVAGCVELHGRVDLADPEFSYGEPAVIRDHPVGYLGLGLVLVVR